MKHIIKPASFIQFFLLSRQALFVGIVGCVVMRLGFFLATRLPLMDLCCQRTRVFFHLGHDMEVSYKMGGTFKSSKSLDHDLVLKPMVTTGDPSSMGDDWCHGELQAIGIAMKTNQ